MTDIPGYTPGCSEEWSAVLEMYGRQTGSQTGSQAGSQAGSQTGSQAGRQAPDGGEGSGITWSRLAALLVQEVGPEEAMAVLEAAALPDGVLSPTFYQACLMAAMVETHQRYRHNSRAGTIRSPSVHYRYRNQPIHIHTVIMLYPFR